MPRTAYNLLQELLDYLIAGEFNAYLDMLPTGSYSAMKNADGEIKPYVIITATPTHLLRRDKRAANNNNATRTLNVFVKCYAGSRLEAAELAEKVDNYLLPDNNAGWHASDGTPLQTYASWKQEPAFTSTQDTIYCNSLAYICKKNLPQFTV
jgi:hypothetical protein